MRNAIAAVVLCIFLLGTSDGALAGNGDVLHLPTVASIKALGAASSLYGNVIVDGYTTAGDGGGGYFTYTASTITPDICVNFAPSAGGGTWVRQVPSSGLSVRQCGAKGDGTTNDTAAFNAAVVRAQASVGTVRVPSGSYKIGCGPTVSGFASGVVVPFTGLSFTGSAHRVSIVGDGPATALHAACNNEVVFWLSDSYTSLWGVSIDGTGFTGTVGIGIMPQDVAQTSTQVNNNYNNVANILITNNAVGIALQCGPIVIGAASGCWYNNITNYAITDNIIGVDFRDGPNSSSSAVNDTNISFGRVGNGGSTACNVAFNINGGATGTVISSTIIEGCNNGSFPHATPTMIYIYASGAVSGEQTYDTILSGIKFECDGCSGYKQMYNAGTETQIVGGSFDPTLFTGPAVPLLVSAIDTAVSSPTINMTSGGNPALSSSIFNGSGGGVNSNGLALLSNTYYDYPSASFLQGNATLPSWLASINTVNGSGDAASRDAFTVSREAAGGMGTFSPLFGVLAGGQLRVPTKNSPASGDACTIGSWTWDVSYFYICTASGAWKRAALTGGY